MNVPYHPRISIPAMAILALCLIVSAAAAASGIVSIENGQVTTLGGSQSLNLTLDSAPAGLSGYDLDISVADPSVATITGVSFPDWAALKDNGTVPASSVHLMAVDLNDKVGPNAANIALATVTVQGLKGGSTPLRITVNEMDDDAGNMISPNTPPGTFTVNVAQPAGNISVTSAPAGAAISIDGTDTGQITPYTFDSQTPGTHLVNITLAGYQPAGQTVSVVTGSSVNADFTLIQLPIAGSLAVTSTPAGAEISIDGTDTGQITPYTFDSQTPGTHLVNVTLAGYQPAGQSVSVVTGSTVNADFSLIQMPTTGSLAVTSTPSGAEILLDGMDSGKTTPFTFSDLVPGDHQVNVSLNGYNPASTTITIVAGDVASTDFQLVAVPQTGTLVVSSVPAGAAISLDGTDTGSVTPFTFTGIAAGDHTVDVSLAGYTPATKTVTVPAGSSVTADFSLVIVPPQTGSIAVSSTPSGAAISLDGTDTGKTTPATLDAIAPGDHTVAVSLSGYNPASRVVTVVAGSTANADFALNQMPRNGSIAVTSTPAGASIEIDGIATNKVTPNTFDGIVPGDHAVSVALAGYTTASTTVTVAAGSTADASFVLTVAPQTGAIAVTTSPAGAAISLDGTDTGKISPATLSGVTPGAHLVSVNLTGYKPSSKKVMVKAGSTANADFRLVHAAPQADVAVTMTVSNTTASVGDPVTWTVTVINNGPDQAGNIVVREDTSFSSGITRRNVLSPSSGFVVGNLWKIPTLSPGQSASLTEKNVYAFPGTKTDNARIVTAATRDPNPSNNTASASIIIIAKPAPAPGVTGISPATGEAGSTLRTVIVRGDNFRSGATVLLNSTNGSLAPSRISVNGRSMISMALSIPKDTPEGVYDVTVRNPDGQSGTLSHAFTVTLPKPPVVSQIAPSQGEAGRTIRNVRVTGDNFRRGAVVRLSDAGQRDVVFSDTIVSDAQTITGTISLPKDTKADTWDVVVTNPDGKSGVEAAAFTVKNATRQTPMPTPTPGHRH